MFVVKIYSKILCKYLKFEYFGEKTKKNPSIGDKNIFIIFEKNSRFNLE